METHVSQSDNYAMFILLWYFLIFSTSFFFFSTSFLKTATEDPPDSIHSLLRGFDSQFENSLCKGIMIRQVVLSEYCQNYPPIFYSTVNGIILKF